MVTFMLNTNVPVVHFYSAAWPNIPPPLTPKDRALPQVPYHVLPYLSSNHLGYPLHEDLLSAVEADVHLALLRLS